LSIFADVVTAIGQFFKAVWDAITGLFSSDPPDHVVQPCPMSHPMTPAKAQEYFDKFKSQQDQIPFDYPVDCCYTRAEVMADQIAADGYSVGKVWNYASGYPNATLTYDSDKVPGGQGHWVYHVAPIVPVQQPDGSVQMMVIDPSTQSGPVPIDQWKRDQHDPGARTVTTDATPYYLSPDGVPHPETPSSRVDVVLARHRASREALNASMARPLP
jgi:hypothetical protein